MCQSAEQPNWKSLIAAGTPMAAFLFGQPVKMIQTPKKSCSGVNYRCSDAAIKVKMLCIRVDFNRAGRAFGPVFGPVDSVTASVL